METQGVTPARVRTIVVPLDGSARAEKALPFAVDIARETGGTLVLVGVVMDTPPIYAPCFVRPDIRVYVERAQRYLDRIASTLTLPGQLVRTVVTRGAPVTSLLCQFGKEQADLVVMSSHGRTGVSRWVLGSVANEIVRRSKVPVLVVSEQSEAYTQSALAHRAVVRAIVPLDGSEDLEAAIRPAIRLLEARCASQRTCELMLAGFIPQFSGGARQQDLSPAEMRSYLERIAEALRQSDLAGSAVRVTHAVEITADAPRRLIELAAEPAEDGSPVEAFIAITPRGQRASARDRLEDITTRLLVSAPVPVLAADPPDAHLGERIADTAV